MAAPLEGEPPPEAGLLAALLEESLSAVEVPIRAPVGVAAIESFRWAIPPSRAAKFGLDRARGALVVALPYGEGPPEPAWAAAIPGTRASIARFARANYYGELVARLRAAAERTRAALRERGYSAGRGRDWRYLANSGLPERGFALAAGLGSLGRQGLVMAEGKGSALVLGLLLLPFELSCAPTRKPEELAPGYSCGSCRACVDACPTGALDGLLRGGAFSRELCLQHWSAIPGALPELIEKEWGSRLYGCDLCQEACPRFRLDPGSSIDRGALGPGLPAAWLLRASEAEMRERLKGSALGMAWMPPAAFKRNAALALKAGI